MFDNISTHQIEYEGQWKKISFIVSLMRKKQIHEVMNY